MKKLLTLLMFNLMLAFSYAQTPVRLVMHHHLGTNDFALGTAASNNLGNAFNLSALKYYVTKFTIVHNGGQLMTVPDDVVALVTVNGASTTIELGSFSVTNIEGIRFHIGVHTPVNHEDPSLLPSNNPLAPQSPSMHWGWASGYRFILLEGMAGASLNQGLELHGLGDANYFETIVLAQSVNENGGESIHIDADYEKGLKDINVSGGLVVHGELAEAADLIANFRDHVYSATLGASIGETTTEGGMSIYPNPSHGSFTVAFAGVEGKLVINDVSGKMVHTEEILFGTTTKSLSLPEEGIYFVTLHTSQGTSTQQLVIK
ncbi:MAG: T9SS type A sorting domain-containing protein [Fluviicola sp.]|nr:T9SS type A sorting domain-containing protein [Fluviicola sp.]